MVMRRFFPSTINGGNGGFEPEYQSVLDRASFLGYTTPDSTTNNRNNDRVKNLKDTGIYAKLDLLYMFDQPTGLADFAKLNYIDPDNFEVFNSTPSLEPNFVADSGFKSDGTLWFDTGFDASVHGVNLTNVNDVDARGSVFYKGFDFTNSATGESICGARTGNNGLQILVAKGSDGISGLWRLGTTDPSDSFDGTEQNNHILSSSSGLQSGLTPKVYKNGVAEVFGYTMSGSGFSNLNTFLFAFNSSGTASLISQSGLSYFGYGGYMGGDDTNQEAIDLYNIMNDTYTP